ncbi:TPR repeat-containing protein [Cryptosporidium serpentis]
MLLKKGNLKYCSGKYLESIKIYSKILDSIEIESNLKLKLQVLSNRAASFIKLARYEDSIKDCNAVLKWDHSNIKVLYRRATCFKELGKDLIVAMNDLKKILSIDPKNILAKEMLKDLIENQNKQNEKNIMNESPNIILINLKTLLDNIDLNKDEEILKNKNIIETDIFDMLLKIQMYIINNGAEIIMNSDNRDYLIFILEKLIYIHNEKDFLQKGENIDHLSIRENKFNLVKEIPKYVILSWNILSLLIQEPIPNLNELCDTNKSNTTESYNKLKTLDINELREILNNKNIINISKLSILMDYIERVNNIYESQILLLYEHIFNVIRFLGDLNHDELLHFILEISKKTKTNFKIINLSLNCLTSWFQKRASMGLRIEALELTSDIEYLIKNMMKLIYETYEHSLLVGYFNSEYEDVILKCGYILSMIIALLSDKNRNKEIDILKLTRQYIIQDYLLPSIVDPNILNNTNNNQGTEEIVTSSNWLIKNPIGFITGLAGLKVSHNSNRDILQNHILVYPQIMHCLLLITMVNCKEFESMIRRSTLNIKDIYDDFPSIFKEDIYKNLLQYNCIEVLSYTMEYKQTRISLTKEDDTIIMLYTICKQTLGDFVKSEHLSVLKSLDSTCRLLCGLVKTTMENDKVLNILLNEIFISELIISIWITLKQEFQKIISKKDQKIFFSCLQNLFEALNILAIHKDFKVTLLDIKINESNKSEKNKTFKQNSLEDTKLNKILFICEILNIFQIFEFKQFTNKGQSNLPQILIYLYVNFIESILTSNETDPSANISQNTKNNKGSELNQEEFFNNRTNFLKRLRFYGQQDQNLDFDETQLSQLEFLYRKLPEQMKSDRNGFYDRGDESLVNSFRQLLIFNTSTVSTLFKILKMLSSQTTCTIIMKIGNSICDLISPPESLNKNVDSQSSNDYIANRGRIIQQGGLKCLLDCISFIEQNHKNKSPNSISGTILLSSKYILDRLREYRQGISRLLIATPPKLITYKTLMTCSIQIQVLLEDDHELLQYEAALSLTNILSINYDQNKDTEDQIALRIYDNSKGWNLFKDLCFSNNKLLVSAGLEGLCNFCNKDEVVYRHFIQSKHKGLEDLKLFTAFIFEDNYRIQIASLGALAMLSAYIDVCTTMILNWDIFGTKIISFVQSLVDKVANPELNKRILFYFNNILLLLNHIDDKNENKTNNANIKQLRNKLGDHELDLIKVNLLSNISIIQ